MKLKNARVKFFLNTTVASRKMALLLGGFNLVSCALLDW
jgi:hypothetical protein